MTLTDEAAEYAAEFHGAPAAVQGLMSDALGAALDRLQRDADRYRWLCGNNFDREGTTQVHTWLRTWELHSQTGQPIEWTQRVRGSTLDSVIDAAMVADAAGAA